MSQGVTKWFLPTPNAPVRVAVWLSRRASWKIRIYDTAYPNGDQVRAYRLFRFCCDVYKHVAVPSAEESPEMHEQISRNTLLRATTKGEETNGAE